MSTKDILASLDPELRKRVKSAMDLEPRLVQTPSMQLNLDLGGGLPLGRAVTIWGSKSAGKTSLALQALGLAQQEGLTCSYIDAEGTYDPRWGARLGVDNDELIYFDTKSMGQAADDMTNLMHAKVDIIMVDSISALVPRSYLDKEELKGFDGTKQIGSRARDIGNMMEILNYANDKTLVILIAQARMAQKGAMHWGQQSQGGKALEYYSSQMIRLNSTDSRVKAAQVFSGNSIMKIPAYREVDYTVQFNKVGPQSGTGTYDFWFRGEKVGVDSTKDLIKVAVLHGVIEKGGKWINYEDESFDGDAAFKDYLDENPQVEKQIREELLESL